MMRYPHHLIRTICLHKEDLIAEWLAVICRHRPRRYQRPGVVRPYHRQMLVSVPVAYSAVEYLIPYIRRCQVAPYCPIAIISPEVDVNVCS